MVKKLNKKRDVTTKSDLDRYCAQIGPGSPCTRLPAQLGVWRVQHHIMGISPIKSEFEAETMVHGTTLC